MNVRRTGIVLRPDASRILVRRFEPGDPVRSTKIIARILAMPEEAVCAEAERVQAEFHGRHRGIEQFFAMRFEEMRPFLVTDVEVSPERRLLIGAYFTQEYSLESAALFNPSIVWHPDQANVPEGARRFILSLRATGEGHISSITFRCGLLHADARIELDPIAPFVSMPATHPHRSFEHKLFERKLLELNLLNPFARDVLSRLAASFAMEDLEAALAAAGREARPRTREQETAARGMRSLALANYEVEYPEDSALCERILFPTSPTERNGIEDARFVEFIDDDGSRTYYATYTAYDGHIILPQLLETEDFRRFRMFTLNGPEAQNKGMALFPRRIDGLYAVISRQDNENVYLMFSDHLHFWYEKKLLLKPSYPWEFVQLGNCGSPIETEAGWLVLTHGVGPMRRYCIGCFLLDRDDPARVIGRLREPLLSPNENEREGYVPNVVYSCGAVVHGGRMILPYAMSDYATSFAVVDLGELLDALTH